MVVGTYRQVAHVAMQTVTKRRAPRSQAFKVSPLRYLCVNANCV